MSHTRQQKYKTKRDDDILDLLPPDFEPSEWDVICQRGKECFEHVGNRRFRAAIDRSLDRYLQVQSRQEKSIIVSEIVGTIRAVSEASTSLSGGGFVRKDLMTRQWYRVGDKVAREKAGQALRDAIKTRRAGERKKVQDEITDERCNHPCISTGHAQHTFQSPIKIANGSFSDRDDDGSSSMMSCGVKRHHDEAFETNVTSEETARPPSRVYSNDAIISSHPSKSDGNIVGSSEVHGRPLGLCLNDKFNQNQCESFLSFLPIVPSSEHDFQSEFLSDLEPRPLPRPLASVVRPSNAHKMILPTNLGEHPASDRIGSMEYRNYINNNANNPTMVVAESVVTLIDEQKPRLFAHQTRSEESALHLLTQLLQPEEGNDISPYYKHFFVSSTNNGHSSHIDEFGFCCDIVGLERPSVQQLADLGDCSSCVGSSEGETSLFDMMDHRTTGRNDSCTTVVISDKVTQDLPLVKYTHQAPQPLLEGPPQHHFLSSTFGSDQFLTNGSMGRGGGGLLDSRPGSSSIWYPDVTKSNIPLQASILPRDTQGCTKKV